LWQWLGEPVWGQARRRKRHEALSRSWRLTYKCRAFRNGHWRALS
jgi:hypothetical protein